MRIAVFHELPSGGARIAVNEISAHLKKNNKIDLYYVDEWDESKENKNYNKVFFYKFKEKKWNGGNPMTRIYKDSIELIKLNSLHKNIANDIDNKNYDLVFVNASKFIESPFILKHLKTKSVFYLHDPHFRVIYESELSIPKNLDLIRRSYEKIHRKILKQLDRTNLHAAKLLIANSKFTHDQTLKTYGRTSELGYLGINTDFFVPKNIKKEIDILFVGSKDKLDGYPLLKSILEKMKNKPKIRQIFKETEWVSRNKIRELYQRSKLIIALAVNEPFGLTPLEAAACGVPTVAVDEAGYRETIINGKTGYLVKRNSEKIAQRLEDLFSHPNEIKKLGIAAYKNSREWSWKIKIKKIEKILVNFSLNKD